MANEVIDYQAVIDDLRGKQSAMNARFDAAIAAIQQVMTLQAGNDVQPALPGLRSLPQAVPASLPYHQLNMVDAAKRHLSSVGHHVPNLELAAALVKGGFPHKSKNFPNTLNSVLWRRFKTTGDVVKDGTGWGLAEWKRSPSAL